MEEAKKENNGSIGILNKGTNNTFIGNAFKNLSIGIQDEGKGTVALDNEFLVSKLYDDLYAEILNWAASRVKFNEKELFDSFPQLNSLKDWYLHTFREFNNELISVYNGGNGGHYFGLTVKGRVEYRNWNANQKGNGDKIEVVFGDRIAGDKIQQHGSKNKAVIKKGFSESFLSKVFWLIIIPVAVGLLVYFLSIIIWQK